MSLKTKNTETQPNRAEQRAQHVINEPNNAIKINMHEWRSRFATRDSLADADR